MEQNGKNTGSNEVAGVESRFLQLLQVWRDYYDEIFEVDTEKGTFVSLMETTDKYWADKGFVEIETILLAANRVHPDDKAEFSEFFNLESIEKNVSRGIFVTKLNFRLKTESDEYCWVKVKNIVSSTTDTKHFKFFACFRKVDAETDRDLRNRQELIDALEQERKANAGKTELLNQVTTQIKAPLNGIIGLAGLAKEDCSDEAAAQDKFAQIEKEAIKMNRILRLLSEANATPNLVEQEFEERPVNKINYGRRKDDGDDESEVADVPEDFAYLSEANSAVDASEFEEFDFKGRRILLVEDNRLTVNVMREMLSKANAQCDVAEDGKQAVIEFVANPVGSYAAVLMDINIPMLDGYSVAKCIRISGKDDGESIPIIAATANARNSDMTKAYKAGFNAFFIKPLDFKQLFARLEKLIG